MPLVTIFTPTHNRAHTLHRVYDSLVAQTFKDFEWLVINDGSSDHTDDVMAGYISEDILNIRYIKQPNAHKFISIYNALQLTDSPYFSVLDSDDALTPNALEILIKYFPDYGNIIHINGLAIDQFGNIYGKSYPVSPLDCSVFDLKYKYQCKGENWGLGLTEAYKKIDWGIDSYQDKGFIPEGRVFYYFDTLGKHRFVNIPVRIYYRDNTDEASLGNNFYNDKNAFGLAETYKAFIDAYRDKWTSYPKAMFRNLMGYLIFSAKDGRSYDKVLSEAPTLFTKIMSAIFYIGKPFLAKINIQG